MRTIGLFVLIWSCALAMACGNAEPPAEEPSRPDATPPPALESEAAETAVEAVLYSFEEDLPGSLPGGFSAAHSGKGRSGAWEVVEDATGSKAVAQTDADATSYRFPVLVLDGSRARDLELGVRFRPISGETDQAAGLVWRYQDPGNYYVVRANALEDNVVLYKMEKGKRSDLDVKGTLLSYGADAEVPAAAWSELAVTVAGDLFTVFLNGEELFQVEDSTFPQAGAVGLWTKADSVTWFDDLRLLVKDDEEGR